jgi:riboflavin kinase / FMN adenylyltransferase
MVRIWRSLDEVPTDLGRTVVTIGNFDGVHLGHQHVIARAREVATSLGFDHVVAVTFDPHPIAVLRPEHAPPTLTSMAVRVELLEQAGADDVLVVPFNRELAGWSPERFIEEILVGTLRAKAVVVGANFRFGHKAGGDVRLLAELGVELDFTTEGIPLDGGPQVWSSTYVRNCLLAGDVDGAEEALGRQFSLRGAVVQGDARGRELGFPTANVPVQGLCVPSDGVYAGWLTVVGSSERLPAAISIGTNPTFDGERERRVEAYVLDRADLELHGVEVEVAFAARIRGMKKFDSIEELVETINDDVAETRRLLSLSPADG